MYFSLCTIFHFSFDNVSTHSRTLARKTSDQLPTPPPCHVVCLHILFCFAHNFFNANRAIKSENGRKLRGWVDRVGKRDQQFVDKKSYFAEIENVKSKQTRVENFHTFLVDTFALHKFIKASNSCLSFCHLDCWLGYTTSATTTKKSDSRHDSLRQQKVQYWHSWASIKMVLVKTPERIKFIINFSKINNINLD